ncbi:hypothetical protein SEA_PETTERN_72 [Mycobacterium phage PetterN]|nr:hypothetical protein SEA_PETTERN_72 [Mycobacterium phage PetterN]
MMEDIEAEFLNGSHIGKTVEFYWMFPLSLVSARISGELREIHHDSEGYVSVWLSNASSGEKQEFSIYHRKQVDVYA